MLVMTCSRPIEWPVRSIRPCWQIFAVRLTPPDKVLTELIGELDTYSEIFRTRWAKHNVRFHRTGFKKVHHRVVGDLDLNFEAMELLASWAATQDRLDPAEDKETSM